MEVNILLFDDFDTMDAFGPAEVFGSSPQHFHVNYLSVPGNIVNSMQGVKVWTEPLEPEGLIVTSNYLATNRDRRRCDRKVTPFFCVRRLILQYWVR